MIIIVYSATCCGIYNCNHCELHAQIPRANLVYKCEIRLEPQDATWFTSVMIGWNRFMVTNVILQNTSLLRNCRIFFIM